MEYMEEHGLSEELATQRATMYQVKITKEGLVNAFKVSKEIMTKYDTETGEEIPRYQRTFNPDTGEIDSDGLPEHVEDRLFEPAVWQNGDKFYCEGANGYSEPQYFIKVGCVHRLPSWDMVDTDDERSCVKGLHVGGLKYIAWYTGEIHNVFIDPMHVGAVPDSNDGAIRCLQYFVHSSLAGVNGSMYHSSTYAALTDEQWEEMKEEIARRAYRQSRESSTAIMSSVERLPPDGNICLIDADSLLYYEMDKPTYEEAFYGLDSRIKQILEACNTTLYVGFLTSGRCYRYGVDP